MIRLAARRRYKGHPRFGGSCLPNDVLLQHEIFRVSVESAAADGDDLFLRFRHRFSYFIVLPTVLESQRFYIRIAWCSTAST